MITPLYYFKWMFQIYSYSIMSLIPGSLYLGYVDFAIICLPFIYLFGFIADDVIGMDIWRLERESSKTKNL